MSEEEEEELFPVKNVTAYRIPDGHLFDTYQEARAYALTNKVEALLREISQRVFYQGLTADDLSSALLDEIPTMQKIVKYSLLRDAMQQRMVEDANNEDD